MPGILLAIGYTALFLFLVRKMRFFHLEGISTGTIGLVLLLKIAAGTCLWAVYTYIYPVRTDADVFKYFDDSAVMFSALRHEPLDFFKMLFGIRNDSEYFNAHYYHVMNNWVKPWDSSIYNDSHTPIRFNAVVRLFSFGEYHVHTVFASAMSLAGGVALYKALLMVVPKLRKLLFASTLLWPSLLFWTSAGTKEALLMTGLGFFLWCLFGIVHGPAKFWQVLLGVLSLLLLLVVKSYALMSLAPALGFYFWARKGGYTWTKLLAVHGVVLVLVLISGKVIEGYDVLDLLAVKQRDLIGMATSVGSGSLLMPPPLEPHLWSFVKNAPHALYMTFLAPFAMWDRGGMGLLSALENVLVVGLPILALAWSGRRSTWDLPALLFAASVVLYLSLVIGWTTPVVGALVRYRVPMLPFVSLCAILFVDPQRIPGRLRSLLT